MINLPLVIVLFYLYNDISIWGENNLITLLIILKSAFYIYVINVIFYIFPFIYVLNLNIHNIYDIFACIIVLLLLSDIFIVLLLLVLFVYIFILSIPDYKIVL